MSDLASKLSARLERAIQAGAPVVLPWHYVTEIISLLEPRNVTIKCHSCGKAVVTGFPPDSTVDFDPDPEALSAPTTPEVPEQDTE